MTFGDLTPEMLWIMFECFACGIVWTLAYQAWQECRQFDKES